MKATLLLLALLLAWTIALCAAPPVGIRWIAHRGGVVDSRYAENSPASLEAAVKSGYWMIESDIRETKDGAIITQHDPDFQRFFGDPRNANEMTLDQVRALRAKPGGTAPMTFAELTKACKGRLRLMLDIKEPAHSARFYNEIVKELGSSGLLTSVYLIGLEEARPYFKGKVRISATTAELEAAVARGEDVKNLYFLFEWGKTLTPEQVRFAQKHNVPVVPSVNTFHYDKDDPMEHGTSDIRRLRALGVTEFQIDSVYEPAFSTNSVGKLP